jgi:hypothetical protein
VSKEDAIKNRLSISLSPCALVFALAYVLDCVFVSCCCTVASCGCINATATNFNSNVGATAKGKSSMRKHTKFMNRGHPSVMVGPNRMDISR